MRGKGGWLSLHKYGHCPKEIVMVGVGNNADVAYEFFTHDSPYEVVAFSVEKDFLDIYRKFDLPVVPFEEVEKRYSPHKYGMFIAIGYAKLNHLRARFYRQAKEKGYSLVSYISSEAFVWRNVEIGDNCFILENNVIQPFVRIGNDVTLWSGNHIGHCTIIKDHVYIASHAVISGFVEIGEYCFVGVNATFAESVKVQKNCLIGAGATILRDTKEDKVYGIKSTMPRDFDSLSPAAHDMFYPGGDAL